jgi:hypothetical protein
MAGNTTRPALSRGVGRKGDVRGVEVVRVVESIAVIFSSGAAFAARRVVTIINQAQTKRCTAMYVSKALEELNEWWRGREKRSRQVAPEWLWCFLTMLLTSNDVYVLSANSGLPPRKP